MISAFLKKDNGYSPKKCRGSGACDSYYLHNVIYTARPFQNGNFCKGLTAFLLKAEGLYAELFLKSRLLHESYRVNAFGNNVIFGSGPGLKMIYSDCIFQNAFTLTSDTWKSLKNAHRTIEYYLRLTHCTNIGNNGHYSVLDCTKSARPLQNGTFRSLSASSKSIIVLRRYRK